MSQNRKSLFFIKSVSSHLKSMFCESFCAGIPHYVFNIYPLKIPYMSICRKLLNKN